VEFALVIFAHIAALYHYRPVMARWYILAGWLVLFSLMRGIVTGAFEPKLLRDALLIPTFIVLGLTFSSRNLVMVVGFLITLYVGVAMLEAVDTGAYAKLFEIQEFYINTRGFTEADFWNKDSPLFASSHRPDGRFLPLVDLHRLSSFFLEPVGSEAFCIVIWAFLCACYSDISAKARALLTGITLLAIVGTDGRLAIVLTGVLIIVSIVSRRLPFFLTFFYLPIVTAVAVGVVWLGSLKDDADNFSGRLAFSVHLLARFDVEDLFGVTNSLIGLSGDAGLAYLILSQSFWGMLILWGLVTFGARYNTLNQIRFAHVTSVWLSLFMMVGAAFLTIKVAALLWFMYGSIQGEVRHGAVTGHR
jgi:putative polymerase